MRYPQNLGIHISLLAIIRVLVAISRTLPAEIGAIRRKAGSLEAAFVFAMNRDNVGLNQRT